ncbi:iron-sulfur cluster carrier protein [Novimethylophilus kurashikiensis]|uniref:Iron-sulfur cluster carrier protein n=1 Tax=Novimethylophilus kurashikiensis TaxID=1825523 RepID=A0A2R5F8B6_9PROT|nr:hypothetical protein [Novimethylophilus kurashikiensis]GBG14437.1 iron-sulfur cluster carrier protein [Novimethylophilus kurashikiensis]
MTHIVQLGAMAALAIQALPVVAQPVPAPVHHLLAIDISGSTYYHLPELRLHLKNKLSSLVNENDTVSIIWFSGRGQVGTLVEAMKVRSVGDLSTLHTAIDRFLQPMGLTGFKEPLQEAENIIARLKAKTTGSLFNLFFMTDGYDNQWTEREILDLCAKLEKQLDSAAVVEYGWHCNRPLLTKMAETLGGNLVFSEDFQAYTVAFEGSLTGGRSKKVPVKLDYAISGPVFGLAGGTLLSFTPDADNVVLLPEGLPAVAYFTAAPGEAFDRAKHADAHIWASLVPLAQRLETNTLFSVLGALGDVALVNSFSSCFSKEDYSRFQDEALAAANDPAKRYVTGYDANAVPKEDAYTVMELLADLASSDDNLFYPYHEAFHYERIGAATKARSDEAKFEPNDKTKGYPVNGLVWNESRPNVSLRVKVDGKVTLPATRPAGLPEAIDSYIYRNYTIVRDGIVHTRKMAVSLDEATFNKLQANDLLAGEAWEAGKVYVLDYPKVPVINRKMVKGTTAKDTFKLVVDLEVMKATQKVFNDYRNRIAPKVSKKFLLLYGQEATDYLASIGVTDYNGFNPASDSVKTGDVYLAKELKIAVKGLSSLPKVADVEAALAAKKKLKIGEAVMAPALERLENFMSSAVFTSAANGDALLETWLETESKAVTTRTRELQQELAKAKFSIVVGHVWFSDMASMDDNSLEVEVPGFGNAAVTATLKDVEIEK